MTKSLTKEKETPPFILHERRRREVFDERREESEQTIEGDLSVYIYIYICIYLPKIDRECIKIVALVNIGMINHAKC